MERSMGFFGRIEKNKRKALDIIGIIWYNIGTNVKFSVLRSKCGCFDRKKTSNKSKNDLCYGTMRRSTMIFQNANFKKQRGTSM